MGSQLAGYLTRGLGRYNVRIEVYLWGDYHGAEVYHTREGNTPEKQTTLSMVGG